MQQLKSPSTIFSLLVVILLFSRLVLGFTEPSSSPPSSNTPAPLHVGSQGQSKAGGLILNTGGAANGLIVDQGNVGIGTQSPTQKLDVAGYIRAATGLCIGGDCRTSWPSYTPPPPSTCTVRTARGTWVNQGVTVGCAAGEKLSGGGAECYSPDAYHRAAMSQSRPSTDLTAWFAQCPGEDVIGYAICCTQ